MTTFSERLWLEKLALGAPPGVRRLHLADVRVGRRNIPLEAFVIGTEDRKAPTLALFAGVHGLERVGTHVVLSYLESLFEQLVWDTDLQAVFNDMRVVALPLVNPGGMYLRTRSNPRGVDLMRNAPLDADGDPHWLVGGHRISPKLPWFRGNETTGLEVEAESLTRLMREEVLSARVSLALDVHSGFGITDRLWYPWARTRSPIPDLGPMERLSGLLNRTYPHHIYLVEAQSESYTTHGDLWDYLYLEHLRTLRSEGRFFLPLTLEMGSWNWVRKNPRQLLSRLGAFNPGKQHRYERTMRRHLLLVDFLRRAVRHSTAWLSTIAPAK